MYPAFFISIVATLLVATPSAYGAGLGTLREEADRVANIVKDALKDANEVRVADFTDMSEGTSLGGAVGPGLQLAFKEALSRSGVTISANASAILTAEFFVIAEAGEPLSLNVDTSLKDRRNRTLVELASADVRVTDTAEIARSLGAVARVTSDQDSGGQVPKPQRQSELRDRVLNPQAAITGSLIQSDSQSEYAVEILCKPDIAGVAEPLAAELVNRLPFVDVPEGNLYEVRLINKSDKPVAATVSIDGLSTFAFAAAEFRNAETNDPAFTHYIVFPQGHVDETGAEHDGTMTIEGWFQRVEPPDNVLSFLVTEYGKGAASQDGLAAKGEVGAIHVQFSHCLPLPGGANARSGKETGFGPPRSIQFRPARFEIDAPHDFVTIRYDRDLTLTP